MPGKGRKMGGGGVLLERKGTQDLRWLFNYISGSKLLEFESNFIEAKHNFVFNLFSNKIEKKFETYQLT